MNGSRRASLPILVVAGSDSSAGAGVDADREALEAAGVAAHFVVTAWTEQDPSGVHELGAVEPERWGREALRLARAGVGALKFGLLPGEAALCAARELCLSLAAPVPVVLDPLLASSSGTRFHSPRGVRLMLSQLLPLGLVWTPNLGELAELSGTDVEHLRDDLEARESAGGCLLAGGARAVIIKGGHGGEDPVCDSLLSPGAPPQRFLRPRLEGLTLRGTGCRFASHLAAQLALGLDLAQATRSAGEFVGQCLERHARRTPEEE